MSEDASSFEQLDWSRPPPRPGRRRAMLLVAGLALVLVAGGATALLPRDDGTSRLLDGRALPEAVAEEPEEEWSWEVFGMTSRAGAIGDVLVVSDDSGSTALDEDGEELWTSHVSGGLMSRGLQKDVVLVGTYPGSTTALSTKGGDVLWSSDGALPTETAEGFVFYRYEDRSLSLRDPRTGEESWRVTGARNVAVFGETVYVLEDGGLSRLDLESGEKEWTVSPSILPGRETHVSLAATDDMVVVGGDDVMAFDAGDGDVLWSEEGGEYATLVGTYSRGRAYVLTADRPIDELATDLGVFDRDGRVGRLEIAQHGYFWPVPFESDGESYVFDYMGNQVLDEELEVVGEYDGEVELVDGGVYTLEDDGQLSYYELGSSSAEWSIATPGSSRSNLYTELAAFDGRVLVITDDEVVSYK